MKLSRNIALIRQVKQKLKYQKTLQKEDKEYQQGYKTEIAPEGGRIWKL